MEQVAAAWYAQRSTTAAAWPLERLIAAKARGGETISVVIPARNEQASVGTVVRRIREELMKAAPLVDELLVMDSLSDDDTAGEARRCGAEVWSVADVRPDLGVWPGKGEALWKAQFVTSGTVLVFVDADLTEWGPHFVTGLVGPLLDNADTLLVKGFYDRLLDIAPGSRSAEGGRVTELVARPLLALHWPELSAVVQPLAGEWAIRRSLFERLSVPVGYGIEFATLVDTWARHGLGAIAQVDLGQRGHRHQNVHDLGLMALEIFATADARRPGARAAREVQAELAQYDRSAVGNWRMRSVPTWERPPAATTAAAGC